MRDPTEICSDTVAYISYNVIKGLALKPAHSARICGHCAFRELPGDFFFTPHEAS